jgi:diacylglycerol kinase family enzyme
MSLLVSDVHLKITDKYYFIMMALVGIDTFTNNSVRQSRKQQRYGQKLAFRLHGSLILNRCSFRWLHKPLETAETIHKILVDGLICIFANVQFNSIEKFNYI